MRFLPRVPARRCRPALALTAGLVTLMTLAAPASALPFGSFSPRAQAMGGAVVASGTANDAAFGNPALLAARQRHDHFALAFPIVTAEAANARDFRDKLDAVQSAYDRVNSTIQACSGGSTCSGSARSAAVSALQRLDSSLAAIDGEPVEGDLFAGFSAGVPGSTAGVALFVDSRIVGDAVAHYDSRDRTQIQAAESSIQSTGTTPVNPANNVYSSGVFRGAMVTEAGLAMAHRFGTLSVGISPKLQRVQTIDYTAAIDNASFNRKTATSSTNANLDAGVVDQLGRNWRVGVVGKNLVSHTYTTDAGNRIHLRPSYRVGVARSKGWLTLAADYDLSTNRSVGGLGGDTRFLSLGAEFNVLDTLQLRVGVKDNTASGATFKHAITGGVGLRVLGAHIDLAAMKGGRELGAALQAGFSF
ncbi:MAG TPA: conjugal transfer protein TraF [Gammaproteobacteria bacterium]|nr:conjugal transfer protein TraF [Gammaproteobacteria bacterium]